jgi:hypothetical protein
VGALSQKEVGDYLNKFYVSSHQKIGAFTFAAGGQKQGGNVASYFCTPDGRVLHVVVGPITGAKMLEEARWVEEIWKLAEMHELKSLTQLQTLFRHVHLERLAKEHNLRIKTQKLPALEPLNASATVRGAFVDALLNQSWNQQAKAHLLLASFPMAKVARVYGTVFESILNETISTSPVIRKG